MNVSSNVSTYPNAGVVVGEEIYRNPRISRKRVRKAWRILKLSLAKKALQEEYKRVAKNQPWRRREGEIKKENVVVLSEKKGDVPGLVSNWGKAERVGGGEVYPCPRRGGASRCLGSKNCLMCQGSIWEVLWDEYIDPNQGWIVSSTSVWHPYYNVLGADSKDVSSFLMTVETEAT